MLKAPSSVKSRLAFISVEEGLDAVLLNCDDRTSGAGLQILADTGVRQNVHSSVRLVHKLFPEGLVLHTGKRMLFVVILIHKGSYANLRPFRIGYSIHQTIVKISGIGPYSSCIVIIHIELCLLLDILHNVDDVHHTIIVIAGKSRGAVTLHIVISIPIHFGVCERTGGVFTPLVRII